MTVRAGVVIRSAAVSPCAFVPAGAAARVRKQGRLVSAAVEVQFGQGVSFGDDADRPAGVVDDGQRVEAGAIMTPTSSLNDVSGTAVITCRVITSATVGSRI